MALFSVRSERQLCERLGYDMLFKWFLDMNILDASFNHSVFSKNKERLLEADVSREFFTKIVDQARDRGLLSDEHFSVDGTLLDAWASMKSFRPKGEDGPADPRYAPLRPSVIVKWRLIRPPGGAKQGNCDGGDPGPQGEQNPVNCSAESCADPATRQASPQGNPLEVLDGEQTVRESRSVCGWPNPESTERRLWGQSLKKPEGAPSRASQLPQRAIGALCGD